MRYVVRLPYTKATRLTRPVRLTTSFTACWRDEMEGEPVTVLEFMECTTCAAKPGSLCPSCLHNREVIGMLKKHINRHCLFVDPDAERQIRPTFPRPDFET